MFGRLLLHTVRVYVNNIHRRYARSFFPRVSIPCQGKHTVQVNRVTAVDGGRTVLYLFNMLGLIFVSL